jgi:ribonuclease P protein component
MASHTPNTDSETLIEVVRLSKRPQFLFARGGTSERRKTIVVQARPRIQVLGDRNTHIGEGFTATKKIGNAVIRNRAKRRLRHAAQALLPQLGVAGCDYVFIARHNTADTAWPRLLDDMESALISLGADMRARMATA